MPSIKIGNKRITLAMTTVERKQKKMTQWQLKREEESKLIFRLKGQGYTHKEINQLTGISTTVVGNILKNEYGIRDIPLITQIKRDRSKWSRKKQQQ